MTYEEQKLRNLFTRIGVVMCIFVPLISLLYGGAEMLQQFLTGMFPRSVALYCVTDILSSACYFLSFFIPVLIFGAISKNQNPQPVNFSLRLPREHTRLKTVAILFVSLGVVLAMAYINARFIPSPGAETLVSGAAKPYQLVLLVLSTAVVPAFCEELLFRGVILTNLKPYGKVVAVIGSALMFCFMHMNAAQLLYTFAAGVVFGVVYLETGSIWVSILLHFLNNFLSILENYLFDVFPVRTANLICAIYELTLLLLGILFAAAYLAVKKREAREEKDGGVFGGTGYIRENAVCVDSRKTVKLFFCPAIVVFLVLSVLNMVVYWVMMSAV